MTHIYGIDESGLPFVDRAEKIAGEIKPHAIEVDRNAVFPRAAIASLGQQGFFGLCIPRDAGGQGQTPGVFAGVVV